MRALNSPSLICGVTHMNNNLDYFIAHRSRVQKDPKRYRAWMIATLIASDRAVREIPPVSLARIHWLEREEVNV
jgi:hypothetical protein